MINETEFNSALVIDVAKRMAVAARTAPKARGNDNLEIAVATGETIAKIAAKMHEQADRDGMPFFHRDAGNIEKSPAILLLGTRIKVQGLKKCGMCGFENCAAKEKQADTPCIFNTHDLGIAVGSAVSVAADNRIDSRVMFSVGRAVLELGLMPADVKVIFAIPLSATGKSPFFDRPAV
jgi:uncharacterized ferredoxin-like protein